MTTENLVLDKPMRRQETASDDYETFDPASDYETDASRITLKILEIENFAFIAHMTVGSREYLYCNISVQVNGQPHSVDIIWNWRTYSAVTLDSSDDVYQSTDYWDIFAYLQRVGYALNSSQVTDFRDNLQAMIDEARTDAGLPVGDN